jgi:hypothetical protein
MASIAVGAAVGEGFLLIRRQPAAVAIWALILIAFLAARAAVYLPLYGVMISAVMENVRSGSTAPPNVAALLPQIQQLQALGLLLGLGQLVVSAILSCAVFRSVLHPEESRLGYLRFGAAELFLSVFYLALIIVMVIGAVFLAIPLAIIAALLGQASAASAAAFGAIAIVLAIAGVVWLALRLSMVGPMLVEEGQIRLGEAWSLTRGHAGALFLIGLILVLLFIAAELVVGGAAIAAFAAATGGLSPSTFLHVSPPAALTRLTPALCVLGVGLLLLFAVVTPVFNAPWARAYKDLGKTAAAATFS